MGGQRVTIINHASCSCGKTGSYGSYAYMIALGEGMGTVWAITPCADGARHRVSANMFHAVYVRNAKFSEAPRSVAKQIEVK